MQSSFSPPASPQRPAMTIMKRPPDGTMGDMRMQRVIQQPQMIGTGSPGGMPNMPGGPPGTTRTVPAQQVHPWGNRPLPIGPDMPPSRPPMMPMADRGRRSVSFMEPNAGLPAQRVLIGSGPMDPRASQTFVPMSSMPGMVGRPPPSPSQMGGQPVPQSGPNSRQAASVGDPRMQSRASLASRSQLGVVATESSSAAKSFVSYGEKTLSGMKSALFGSSSKKGGNHRGPSQPPVTAFVPPHLQQAQAQAQAQAQYRQSQSPAGSTPAMISTPSHRSSTHPKNNSSGGTMAAPFMGSMPPRAAPVPSQGVKGTAFSGTSMPRSLSPPGSYNPQLSAQSSLSIPLQLPPSSQNGSLTGLPRGAAPSAVFGPFTPPQSLMQPIPLRPQASPPPTAMGIRNGVTNTAAPGLLTTRENQQAAPSSASGVPGPATTPGSSDGIGGGIVASSSTYLQSGVSAGKGDAGIAPTASEAARPKLPPPRLSRFADLMIGDSSDDSSEDAALVAPPQLPPQEVPIPAAPGTHEAEMTGDQTSVQYFQRSASGPSADPTQEPPLATTSQLSAEPPAATVVTAVADGLRHHSSTGADDVGDGSVGQGSRAMATPAELATADASLTMSSKNTTQMPLAEAAATLRSFSSNWGAVAPMLPDFAAAAPAPSLAAPPEPPEPKSESASPTLTHSTATPAPEGTASAVPVEGSGVIPRKAPSPKLARPQSASRKERAALVPPKSSRGRSAPAPAANGATRVRTTPSRAQEVTGQTKAARCGPAQASQSPDLTERRPKEEAQSQGDRRARRRRGSSARSTGRGSASVSSDASHRSRRRAVRRARDTEARENDLRGGREGRGYATSSRTQQRSWRAKRRGTTGYSDDDDGYGSYGQHRKTHRSHSTSSTSERISSRRHRHLRGQRSCSSRSERSSSGISSGNRGKRVRWQERARRRANDRHSGSGAEQITSPSITDLSSSMASPTDSRPPPRRTNRRSRRPPSAEGRRGGSAPAPWRGSSRRASYPTRASPIRRPLGLIDLGGGCYVEVPGDAQRHRSRSTSAMRRRPRRESRMRRDTSDLGWEREGRPMATPVGPRQDWSPAPRSRRRRSVAEDWDPYTRWYLSALRQRNDEYASSEHRGGSGEVGRRRGRGPLYDTPRAREWTSRPGLHSPTRSPQRSPALATTPPSYVPGTGGASPTPRPGFGGTPDSAFPLLSYDNRRRKRAHCAHSTSPTRGGYRAPYGDSTRPVTDRAGRLEDEWRTGSLMPSEPLYFERLPFPAHPYNVPELQRPRRVHSAPRQCERESARVTSPTATVVLPSSEEVRSYPHSSRTTAPLTKDTRPLVDGEGAARAVRQSVSSQVCSATSGVSRRPLSPPASPSASPIQADISLCDSSSADEKSLRVRSTTSETKGPRSTSTVATETGTLPGGEGHQALAKPIAMTTYHQPTTSSRARVAGESVRSRSGGASTPPPLLSARSAEAGLTPLRRGCGEAGRVSPSATRSGRFMGELSWQRDDVEWKSWRAAERLRFQDACAQREAATEISGRLHGHTPHHSDAHGRWDSRRDVATGASSESHDDLEGRHDTPRSCHWTPMVKGSPSHSDPHIRSGRRSRRGGAYEEGGGLSARRFSAPPSASRGAEQPPVNPTPRRRRDARAAAGAGESSRATSGSRRATTPLGRSATLHLPGADGRDAGTQPRSARATPWKTPVPRASIGTPLRSRTSSMSPLSRSAGRRPAQTSSTRRSRSPASSMTEYSASWSSQPRRSGDPETPNAVMSVLATPPPLPYSFYSTFKVKEPRRPSAWAMAPERLHLLEDNVVLVTRMPEVAKQAHVVQIDADGTSGRPALLDAAHQGLVDSVVGSSTHAKITKCRRLVPNPSGSNDPATAADAAVAAVEAGQSTRAAARQLLIEEEMRRDERGDPYVVVRSKPYGPEALMVQRRNMKRLALPKVALTATSNGSRPSNGSPRAARPAAAKASHTSHSTKPRASPSRNGPRHHMPEDAVSSWSNLSVSDESGAAVPPSSFPGQRRHSRRGGGGDLAVVEEEEEEEVEFYDGVSDADDDDDGEAGARGVDHLTQAEELLPIDGSGGWR